MNEVIDKRVRCAPMPEGEFDKYPRQCDPAWSRSLCVGTRHKDPLYEAVVLVRALKPYADLKAEGDLISPRAEISALNKQIEQIAQARDSASPGRRRR